MTPTSILHVIDTDGPGGAETVLTNLVGHVDKAEFQTSAVIPSAHGWLAAALREHRVDTADPRAVQARRPIDVGYLSRLGAIIRRNRPAIVHAHSFDSAFYASLASLGTDAALVATFHGAVDVVRHGWRNRIKWIALARASRVVCVSEALRTNARSVPGVRTERLAVIHNGIDLNLFAPRPNRDVRSLYSIPEESLLLGAVGNVRPAKSYEVLMHALAFVRSSGLDARLLIAGDERSPLGKTMLQLRSELDLDNVVHFIGFVDDVPHFLNGIDLFVLSSRSEGFSLATVQALAVGLPVIATRCGGPEEIVQDNFSGLLVPTEAPDEIARAILSLAHSPTERRRLAAAGRDRVAHSFSLTGMISQYESLYLEVVR